MKQNQNGSAHIIILLALVALIGGVLSYTFLKHTNDTTSTATQKNASDQSQKSDSTTKDQAFVKFEDWKVGFSSGTTYTLKRNSGTGNSAAYFIGIKELAGTCATPATPWIGIINRYDKPEEKITVGPDAGKTINQVFGSQGMTINGNLYYYASATQFCTRGASNPQIEDAARKLELEIKSLKAY